MEQRLEFERQQLRYPQSNIDSTNFVIHLDLYQRQYLAALNEEHEIVVWANCFLKIKNDDWQKGLGVY